MGFRAEVEFDFAAAFGRLDSQMGEWNKRMREYLASRAVIGRQVNANPATVPASIVKPLLLDLGGPAPGQLWKVGQVCLWGDQPTTGLVVPSSNYGTQAAPGANTTIVGVGQVGSGANFPPGLYQLTAAGWYGAVAGPADDMKLVANGIATISTLDVPPVANGTPLPRTVYYRLQQPATFLMQSIAGSAGTYKATLDVSQVSDAAVCSIFVGSLPQIADLTSPWPAADCVAPALPFPTVGPVTLHEVTVSGNEHVYALITGGGLLDFSQVFGTAAVLEAVDSPATLSWL